MVFSGKPRRKNANHLDIRPPPLLYRSFFYSNNCPPSTMVGSPKKKRKLLKGFLKNFRPKSTGGKSRNFFSAAAQFGSNETSQGNLNLNWNFQKSKFLSHFFGTFKNILVGLEHQRSCSWTTAAQAAALFFRPENYSILLSGKPQLYPELNSSSSNDSGSKWIKSELSKPRWGCGWR